MSTIGARRKIVLGIQANQCRWTKPSASQFNGAQESPLHHRLKHIIGDLLGADLNAKDVVVDKRLEGEVGHKRPDIRATYSGRPITIELQLSSTQLPIILERERFYCAENRALIWFGWNLAPKSRRDLTQSLLDIATRHRDNLFSIDEQTVRNSQQASRFNFRSFWWVDDVVHTKIQTLDELVFPEKGLAFAMDRPPPWHVQYKKKWVGVTQTTGSKWPDRKVLWAELLENMGFEMETTDFESDHPGLESLLNLLISIESGAIIGSRQKSLTEMLNTFLYASDRQQFAMIVRYVLQRTDNVALMTVPSTTKKFSDAMQTKQADKNSLEARIIRFLFPNWTRPLVGQSITKKA